MSKPIILAYRGITPIIHPTACIAPGAVIVGDVEIGAGSSVWFGCVIRGDMNKVRIGERTNIQDGTIIHVSADRQSAIAQGNYPVDGYPTIIGDDITIGHHAVLHGCIIKSGAFIGMGAVVLDGAKVEGNSILAAGSVLPPGKKVPSGEMWMGNPALFRRHLSHDEIEEFRSRSGQYATLAQEYKEEQQK